MVLSANSWEAEGDGDTQVLNVMFGVVYLLLSSDLLQCDKRNLGSLIAACLRSQGWWEWGMEACLFSYPAHLGLRSNPPITFLVERRLQEGTNWGNLAGICQSKENCKYDLLTIFGQRL